jgi:ApbE superfamily uncharacterized protein (UPF0280 family)
MKKIKELLVKHNFDENVMTQHKDYAFLLSKEKAQLESYIMHEPLFILAKEHMVKNSIKNYSDLLQIPDFS